MLSCSLYLFPLNMHKLSNYNSQLESSNECFRGLFCFVGTYSELIMLGFSLNCLFLLVVKHDVELVALLVEKCLFLLFNLL